MKTLLGIFMGIIIFSVLLGIFWYAIDMASALIRRPVSNLLKIFETGCV